MVVFACVTISSLPQGFEADALVGTACHPIFLLLQGGTLYLQGGTLFLQDSGQCIGRDVAMLPYCACAPMPTDVVAGHVLSLHVCKEMFDERTRMPLTNATSRKRIER